MSLLGALNTGTTALAVEQTALQVTGNNIANAADPDYARQRVLTTPSFEQAIRPGVYVGDGVDLTGVQRQVDDALLERLRGSASDASAATTNQTWIGQIQTTLGALSGSDLSTKLQTYFDSWSSLAGDPTNAGLRQVVVQNGTNLAGYVNGLSNQLGALSATVNAELPAQTKTANDLATDVAKLNVQIVSAGSADGSAANGLWDQRDADLKKLAQLADVTTAAQPNGSVNVFISSQPLVDGQTNFGLSVANLPDGSGVERPTVVFTNTGGAAPITSGSLGALSGVRSQVADASAQLDGIAKKLIFEVNKLHSSGQGTTGAASVQGTNAVADPAAGLGSAAAGLNFTPVNGSFVVHVTQSTGAPVSTLIPVKLTGGAGDTSLNTLAAGINGVAGLSATIVDGRLKIAATDPGATVGFSQDSSGVLATLGINTFFTGSNAGDIAVNAAVAADPSRVAAGSTGERGDNTNALAISKLASDAGATGVSLNQAYDNLVNGVGNAVATANADVAATAGVQSTLSAQQQAVSGVSIDEETVNLLQAQRAYQAAAKVISTVDQMIQTLLQITI